MGFASFAYPRRLEFSSRDKKGDVINRIWVHMGGKKNQEKINLPLNLLMHSEIFFLEKMLCHCPS